MDVEARVKAYQEWDMKRKQDYMAAQGDELEAFQLLFKVYRDPAWAVYREDMMKSWLKKLRKFPACLIEEHESGATEPLSIYDLLTMVKTNSK